MRGQKSENRNPVCGSAGIRKRPVVELSHPWDSPNARRQAEPLRTGAAHVQGQAGLIRSLADRAFTSRRNKAPVR